MQVNSVDPHIDITAQLDGDPPGPVTSMALFHVPAQDADKVSDFLAAVKRGDTPALLKFFDAERDSIFDAGRTVVDPPPARP